jgi:hypothetical protein
VVSFDQALEPLESFVGILVHHRRHVVLLIIAGTLLVAFWGGRFSQSWKLIAIAAFCLYIADMFFAYAINAPTPTWKAACGRCSGPSRRSFSGWGLWWSTAYL